HQQGSGRIVSDDLHAVNNLGGEGVTGDRVVRQRELRPLTDLGPLDREPVMDVLVEHVNHDGADSDLTAGRNRQRGDTGTGSNSVENIELKTQRERRGLQSLELERGV